MVDAVIFDLDGTLLDLPIDYEKFAKEIYRVTKKDVKGSILKTVSSLEGDAKKAVFMIWGELEGAAWKDATVKKDGMKLYKKYSKKPKALVTLQGKTVVCNLTKALRLRFNCVVTREDSLDRSEQLKIASQNLGVDVKNVLFVGNTDGDESAANICGCQFVRIPE